MASIITEYASKQWSVLDFQKELSRLIGEYNKHTKKYIFIYAADSNKVSIQGVDVSLNQDDFYVIQDLLRETKSPIVDFYIETGGGSGTAAEEIAKFLRNKFSEVYFVIAGEAKSAGTLLALSGDDIFMTETGSLGPIDAQVRIGRFSGSAHDYIEWINARKKEADDNGKLNHVDNLIIAQISPLELGGVVNSLEFAKDLVKEWLKNYKFKSWTITKDRQIPVTDQMRADRAKEIAENLCNHTHWRQHGRSLKIEDLKKDLLIQKIDDDPILADFVYRIKTVIRFIFDNSTIFKLFYSQDAHLLRTYTLQQGAQFPLPQQPPNIPPPVTTNAPLPMGAAANATSAKIGVICPRCGKNHEIIGYFNISSEIIKNNKLLVNNGVQDNDTFICDNCKFVLNLKPLKAQLELQTGKKISFK